MFPTVHGSQPTYSSEHVTLNKLESTNETAFKFSASIQGNNSQDRSMSPATAELDRRRNMMRLNLSNLPPQEQDNEPRPATPRLFGQADMLLQQAELANVMASPASKKAFLESWQNGRAIGLISEEELGEFTRAGTRNGTHTDSGMDEGVACEIGSASSGSLGAGSCAIGLARANFGDKVEYASIHKSLPENSWTPGQAHLQVIHPLIQELINKTGQFPQHIDFGFVGGDPSTFDASIVLAYAIKQFAARNPNVNVPVCMLGINPKNSYVDAAVTAPTSPNDPKSAFRIAQVVEDSSSDEEK